MLSKEKIIIRINLFFRNLLYNLLFWYACLLFYVFLTGESEFFKSFFHLFKVDSLFLDVFLFAVSIAFLFSLFDAFFTDRTFRFAPIKLLVFLRSFLYFILALIVLMTALQTPIELILKRDFKALLSFIKDLDLDFIRFLVYFYLSCFFNNFFKGAVKKVGIGNFRNWFFGMMNKPGEEERIFMFVDMKSSTTIAEKLQHRKFSHLVQDIFNDMAVVDNYNGQIYQYLGDGAIISWNLKNGLKNNNFIKAFFAFTNVVNRRTKYYKRKYGLAPKFKAGLHAGKVMVLQVGRIRRDISYNGDTINTAARIESMCAEYKQDLLISGVLFDMVLDKEEYKFKNIGNIKLKGKRRGVDIFQVNEN